MKAISSSLIYILLCIGTSGGEIIHVPTDQPTIQEGIKAANDGDTVLVQPGTYVENINFNGKNLVVGSLFIVSMDTNLISQTVINGDRHGSVLTFENGEDSSSVISGFTITNGQGGDPCLLCPGYTGGGITCRNGSHPTLRNLVVSGNSAVSKGAGIYCEASNPLVIQVTISENASNDFGGGIFCDNSSPLLSGVTIERNSAGIQGGGMYCDGNSNPIFDVNVRSNVILNKAGDTGYDLFNDGDVTIKVMVNTFTVISPKEYHAYPIEKFDLNILNAKIDQVEADLYVAPNGNNANTGLSPSDPLKTIDYTLAKVLADSIHPRTIYLAEGIYSPSTNNERYPLFWRSHITLSGKHEQTTILDAEDHTGILYFYNDNEFRIEELTIQNGVAENGGGIHLVNSSPKFTKISIVGNAADGGGGGIFCFQSSPVLTGVTIADNTSHTGGGIYCGVNSSPSLTDISVTANSAKFQGGGIYCWEDSSPILNYVTITGNYAQQSGGGIYCNDNSNPRLIHVAISDNIAEFSDGGGIFCCASEAVLKNVKIVGNSGGSGGGIWMGSADLNLNNVTIHGNITSGGAGGGICCVNSSSFLKNVALTANSAGANLEGVGGGIYCSASNFTLVNVTLSANAAADGGGIYCFDHSNPVLVNTILWNNSPQEVYFSFSLPHDSNSVTIAFSGVQGGKTSVITNNKGSINWLEGNIDLDPLFVDPDSDFSLQAGSPCIDSGTAFFIWKRDTLINSSPDDFIGSAPDIGAFEFGVIHSIERSLSGPSKFRLYQNYPNPFNPVTTISFQLPKLSTICLSIYNMLGQKVKTLVNKEMQPGYREIEWDASNFGSGTYFYRITAGKYSATGKCLLLK